MSLHTAFFYGTLMAEGVLRRVCDSHRQTPRTVALETRPAMLHDYRRHRVWDADYPAIIPCPAIDGSCVRGTLVANLTDADISRLDAFEGSEYERRWVEARVIADVGGEGALTAGKEQGKNDAVRAQTYVWIGDAEGLEDREWDYDEFLREKLLWWAGPASAEEYAEVDKLAADQVDRTGGRGINVSSERSPEQGPGGQ